MNWLLTGAQLCCAPTRDREATEIGRALGLTPVIDHELMPWHFLYFLPEPQGQGSLRPTFAAARTGLGGSAWAAPVWYCRSFCWRCCLRSSWRATSGRREGAGSAARAAALATAACVPPERCWASGGACMSAGWFF